MRDEPRSGRACQTSNQDALREVVDYNLHKSIWILPLDLSASQTAMTWKKRWKVSKLGVWVPHTPNEKK